MHRRVSPSLHRAASLPATVRVVKPLFSCPVTCASLSSTQCGDECSAGVAVILTRAGSHYPHYQAMTLQPALFAWSGPRQAGHSPSPRHLPPGRPKFEHENSVVMLLPMLAGGEELRNRSLPWNAPQMP
ncbi:hypothetical protein M3J09_001551 [Ascochyta lentis]